MAMVPHERSLVERMKDRPFVLLGVNEDDSRATLQATVKDEAMTWRTFYDKNNAILVRWEPAGSLPYLVLIDHTGLIRKTQLGRPRDESFYEAVEDLVREAEQGGGQPSS